MGAEGTQDHPYVAHYDEPDVPDATTPLRRGATPRRSRRPTASRRARWTSPAGALPRYIAGLLLACRAASPAARSP